MEGPAVLVAQHFGRVSDPRKDRGQNHDLLEMIFLALTAALCGSEGWADVERFCKAKQRWFCRYLKLEHGIPSHDTFGRVFCRLDSAAFLEAIHAWIDSFAGCLRQQGIAIDGKTLRGSFDRSCDQSPLHLLTAYATETRLVLRQMKVDSKSNEIPMVADLLKLMDLEGAIVTLDAMHCQKNTARSITAAGADYVLTVKRNQATLHDELASRFQVYAEADYNVKRMRREIRNSVAHGRQERRCCYVVPVEAGDCLQKQWTGIRSVGMMYRESEDANGGRARSEVTYFITSLPAKVGRISKLIRDHWRIENSQHYVLDVTFREDASRIRKGSSPEVGAAFRRMALNILRQDTAVKDNIRGKRLRAGWDDSVLDRIYAGFSST